MTQPAAPTSTRRIEATSAALDVIERLRAKHGSIMFHQSGDDRDGAVPLCYPEDEFFLGPSDVCLGGLSGVPYYVSARQFARWEAMHLTIDVAPGRGGTFSLENAEGVRFQLRTRPFTPAEVATLKPVHRGCPDSGPTTHAADR